MQITGNYLTGLIESDGAFQISFELDSTLKIGFRPILYFTFSQEFANSDCVQAIEEYLCAGTVKPRSDRLTFFIKTQKTLSNKIISHFYKYPLVGEKMESFIIFELFLDRLSENPRQRTVKDFLWLLALFYKKNPDGRKQKLNFWLDKLNNKFTGISLEDFKKTEKELDVVFQQKINSYEMLTVDKPLDNDFILGLTQGDGCFSPLTESVNPRFAYDISFLKHPRNYRLINKVEDFFKSNTTYIDKLTNVIHFKIQDTSKLREGVIPFFEQNKLGFNKGRQFQFFKEYFNLIKC